MAILRIKCPTCGKILKINDAPDINSKNFTCPVCNERHRVGDCLRMVPAPPKSVSNDETQYTAGGDETRYTSGSDVPSEETSFSKPKHTIGVLVDSQGISYQLQMGINNIGRKANSSPASIQIQTEDHFMSRSHAVIEVKDSGGHLLHILSNGANKNPSYLNNAMIEPYDKVILNNGDTVRFGHTLLTFRLPNS